jgi:hypothetical protein
MYEIRAQVPYDSAGRRDKWRCIHYGQRRSAFAADLAITGWLIIAEPQTGGCGFIVLGKRTQVGRKLSCVECRWSAAARASFHCSSRRLSLSKNIPNGADGIKDTTRPRQKVAFSLMWIFSEKTGCHFRGKRTGCGAVSYDTDGGAQWHPELANSFGFLLDVAMKVEFSWRHKIHPFFFIKFSENLTQTFCARRRWMYWQCLWTFFIVAKDLEIIYWCETYCGTKNYSNIKKPYRTLS